MVDYVLWELVKATLPFFIAFELAIFVIIKLLKRSK